MCGCGPRDGQRSSTPSYVGSNPSGPANGVYSVAATPKIVDLVSPVRTWLDTPNLG